jgi:hypothetical protein
VADPEMAPVEGFIARPGGSPVAPKDVGSPVAVIVYVKGELRVAAADCWFVIAGAATSAKVSVPVDDVA